MLTAVFKESLDNVELVMEWGRGGLTKKRFKSVVTELIEMEIQNYFDTGHKINSGVCEIGEYIIYCEVYPNTTGVLEVSKNNIVLFEKKLRRLNMW